MRKLFPPALVLLAAAAAPADDWPQWQGPTRDSISREKGLLKEWPKGGPKLAWTFKDAGEGYSSPAVVGDKLYILGTRDKDEYLFCLDAKKGTETWKLELGPTYDFEGNTWGTGPRATPSVAGGKVFALGSSGDLVCADLAGKEQWSKHMIKDLKGWVNPVGGKDENPGWGYSWSPLADGEKVVCYPGGKEGALAALAVKDGAVLWRSKGLTYQASYASPVALEVGGVRQYAVLFNEGLAGIAAKDGEVLWEYKKATPFNDVVMPTPVFHDGHVYYSAGYTAAGSALVRIDKSGGGFKAAKVYDNKVMKAQVGGVVVVGGHVYGYSRPQGWLCQDLKKGKEVWREKNAMGPGSVTYADGHLYCYDEDTGETALVEVSTQEWKEKGRFALPARAKGRAVNARNWTPPVIANGKLYLRDQELLFCYEIK